MKYEWKKSEKEIYLPKNQPSIIEIPKFKYFSLKGSENPNSQAFGEAVTALYSMSYGIKMAPKKGIVPEGYFDYTIYPLEGFWSLNKEGIEQFKENGTFEKKDLIFEIMIRQPDFVTETLASETLDRISKSKPNPYNSLIQLKELEEGLCVQMLHTGSYDSEPKSFEIMNEYCKNNKLKRLTPYHKEIYLSDPRKSTPEKNRTVLRFMVQSMDSNQW